MEGESANNKKRESSSELENEPKKCKLNDTLNGSFNKDNLHLAIENLNYVRQNKILPNDFNLQLIYEEKSFKLKIDCDSNVSNLENFEFKNIIFPRETIADHLMMIVMNVFSDPINCGYFLKDELELIFSFFTQSRQAQMLFVRLLRRKLAWHRITALKYPEISNNLDPFFKELVKNKFCVSDLDSIDISVLLNMLQVQEIKNICKKLKIDHNGNKPAMISKLLKYGNVSKSFFTGAKSPKFVLKSMILQIVQPCICLPQKIIDLFNKVLTLLHPIQDPSENISDLFFVLSNIKNGELIYPPILKNEAFPIFKNRSHLIDYIEGKNALRRIIEFIEKKEWDEVKNLGRLARKHLSAAQIEEKSSLPLHVKKFRPEYSWLKVLAKSVDAFKKTPDTILEAVDILKILINEKHFFSSQGRWYNELALIEMHHRKNLEESAELTLHALEEGVLTEVDVSGLKERMKKLMRRKTGISEETKKRIENVQEKMSNTEQFTATKTITADMACRNEFKGKSTWSVNINGKDKYYGNVEMLVLHHYTSEEDFHAGLHCEGSLAITLFTVYFWDELYNTFVPGAFVSPYQDAPLDLFTSDFFNNRKETIENKIKFIRKLDLETFSDWMEERYSKYIQFRSLMPNTLFESNEQFKEVVTCLGINGVTGICEKLVSNYRLWRSGFPDLILWNKLISKCKIVEVKGPGDSLSEKQKLWLQYLNKLGIEAEVCRVKAEGINHK